MSEEINIGNLGYVTASNNPLRATRDGKEYEELLPAPDWHEEIVKRNGRVKDTVHEMQKVIKKYAWQTKKLSKELEGNSVYETSKNIWNFLYDHFKYKEDDKGQEQLRTPALSWEVRTTRGIDCDDFSIFAGTLFYNLSIPFYLRIAHYPEFDHFSHVYVIVPSGNKKYIVVDAVLDSFDTEKEPILQTKDFLVMSNGNLNGIDVTVLSGIENETDKEIVGLILGADFPEDEINGVPTSTEDQLDAVYKHLVETRDLIRSNPEVITNNEDPHSFLQMLDYAAYITIKELSKYGVEPQAIEQPLDFSIPEQKLMLAIYLAAPEVDNDRRALNTFHGMRRAKKEGRWMGSCLTGYKHARDANDRKTVVPEGGKQQELIVSAFKLFATGMYPLEEVRKKLKKEGLNISGGHFWRILRHKGYIGMVFIPAYKDEPEQWVQGQHEPLIDETTFYKVQDVFAGRNRPNPPKYSTFRKELPLRGFMQCPQCNGNLTGSASRGRSGERFYYYHCKKKCGERKKAEKINDFFSEILDYLKIDLNGLELSSRVLNQLLHANKKGNQEQLTILSKDIEKQNQRLKNARILMLDGEITPKDYKELKNETEEGLSRLELEQNELKATNVDFTAQINFLIALLSNLDVYFDEGDGETKQKIIGSIFPEKLVFENNKCRTKKINPAVSVLHREKEGKDGKKHPLSGVLLRDVTSARVERATFGFGNRHSIQLSYEVIMPQR